MQDHEPRPLPPGSAFTSGDMKADWDRRARHCAAEYILTGYGGRPPEDFEAEGRAQADFFSRFTTRESRVLDLGCGVGRIGRYLAPRVHEYWGLDVSGEMIRLAQERLAEFPNVQLVVGDGESLAGVPDAHIDFLFSYLTLHHVPRAALLHYLDEARRVLVSRGAFWLQVALREEDQPYEEPPDGDTWMGRRYTIPELQAAAREHYAWEASEVGEDREFVWALLRRRQ